MIICLESDEEIDASNVLARLIELAAETHDRNLRRRLRRLWRRNAFGQDSKYGERWTSIRTKAAVEGSTWYVWWFDGVREFMRTNMWRDR